MISEKLTVVASGGGRADGQSAHALAHAVEITGQSKPKVLIATSPKTTPETASRGALLAHNLFVDQLGLETELLHKFDSMPTDEELTEKIEAADLLYICGGDTDRMMKIWRKTKIAQLVSRQALAGSLVISGISAGAIAPFTWGHSDSLSYRTVEPDEPWDYIAVDGLSLANAAITPHHDSASIMHGTRSSNFLKMFATLAEAKGTMHGFGIDNFAALQILDGKLSPVQSNEGDRQIHHFQMIDGVVTKNVLGTDDVIRL